MSIQNDIEPLLALIFVGRIGQFVEIGRGSEQRAEAPGALGRRHGCARLHAPQREDHEADEDEGRVGEEGARPEILQQHGGEQRADRGADRPVEQQTGGDERVLAGLGVIVAMRGTCLLYTSPSPRDS